MSIEFGLTSGDFNTKYAPLAALGSYWQGHQAFAAFQKMPDLRQNPEFSLADQLCQVLISILANCTYLCEVNARLRGEQALAQAWGYARFLEQSTLAGALNQLNQMNLPFLEQAGQTIWRRHSRVVGHDWRGLLWLDLDLSGLLCGKTAAGSTKGYFSGKKTQLGGN